MQALQPGSSQLAGLTLCCCDYTQRGAAWPGLCSRWRQHTRASCWATTAMGTITTPATTVRAAWQVRTINSGACDALHLPLQFAHRVQRVLSPLKHMRLDVAALLTGFDHHVQPNATSAGSIIGAVVFALIALGLLICLLVRLKRQRAANAAYSQQVRCHSEALCSAKAPDFTSCVHDPAAVCHKPVMLTELRVLRFLRVQNQQGYAGNAAPPTYPGYAGNQQYPPQYPSQQPQPGTYNNQAQGGPPPPPPNMTDAQRQEWEAEQYAK